MNKKSISLLLSLVFLFSVLLIPTPVYAGTTTKYDKQIKATESSIASKKAKVSALSLELKGMLNGGRYIEIYNSMNFDEKLTGDITGFDENLVGVAWERVILTTFATGDVVNIINDKYSNEDLDGVAYATKENWDKAAEDVNNPLVISPVTDSMYSCVCDIIDLQDSITKLTNQLETLKCKKLGYVRVEDENYPGEYYYGQMKNGMWNGQGEYHFSSGNVILGKFVNGNINMGNVTLKCSYDENTGGWAYIYKGAMTDDDDPMFVGYGSMEYFPQNTGHINVDYFKSISQEYPTAVKYVGEFENDTFNGEGKLFDATGQCIYQGFFLDGEISGDGR